MDAIKERRIVLGGFREVKLTLTVFLVFFVLLGVRSGEVACALERNRPGRGGCRGGGGGC